MEENDVKIIKTRKTLSYEHKQKLSVSHIGKNTGRRVKYVKCVCIECNKEFERPPSYIKSKKRSGKFCSRKCQYSWRNREWVGKNSPSWKGGRSIKIDSICENCKKPFKTLIRKVENGEGKFCSRKCTSQYYANKKTYSNKKTHDNIKISNTICKHCGKEIHVIPSRIRNKHGNFCCKDHYIAWQKESEDYKKHFENKRIRIKYTCIICGKEFETTPHWVKLGRTKYCSQECYWKDLTNLMSGSNHHNWMGGISRGKYCEKWTPDLRRRITSFYNDTCIECGQKHNKNERKFHCHHVYYDKSSCCMISDDGKYYTNLGIVNENKSFEIIGNPDKFVLLCASCHHRKGNMKTRSEKARYYENIINTYYGGKSFHTKEEYIYGGYDKQFIIPLYYEINTNL